MKTSCVAHPKSDVMLVLRRWQVDACEGNHCAAALLSFFEYWHTLKLDQQGQAEKANRIAEMHGDAPTQHTSLLQFHNTEELQAGILDLYGASSIEKTLPLLVEKGFISIHSNPNPRYHFDKTRYILFHPDTVNGYLDSVQLRNPSRKNKAPSRKNKAPSRENTAAIPEITSEITPEISPPSPASQGLSPAGKPRAPRAVKRHRCPADYSPGDGVRAWAASHCPGVDFDEALDAMRDYEFRTPRSDWDATLRNWIRRDGQQGQARASPAAAFTSRAVQRDQFNVSTTLQMEEILNGTPGHADVRPGSRPAGSRLPRRIDAPPEAGVLYRAEGPAP